MTMHRRSQLTRTLKPFVSTSPDIAAMPTAAKRLPGVDPRAVPFLDAIAEMLAARTLGEMQSIRVATKPRAAPFPSAHGPVHTGAIVHGLRNHQ